MDEKLIPTEETAPPEVISTETATPTVPTLGVPSAKQQQWGVIISIVVIVLMIVVGAFYAWGKRIAQENALIAPVTAE